MITIKLVHLINGEKTEADGQYLVEYDPRIQRDAEGEFYHLVTTANRAEAAGFATMREALAVYRATSGRVRSDGSMDCPLTAFSVEFEDFRLVEAFEEAADACNRLADAIDEGSFR